MCVTDAVDAGSGESRSFTFKSSVGKTHYNCCYVYTCDLSYYIQLWYIIVP